MVARIERSLAPKGAVVKSPDRIPDLITGQLREVDASVRFQIGSAPVLVTIECRERSNVQDDTWIEQLVSKKQKIGAATTIAVSTKGFTQSAIKSARIYGIELRRVDDITDDKTAQQWIGNITIDAEYIDYLPVEVVIRFDTDLDGVEVARALHDQLLRATWNNTQVVFEKNTGKSYTPQDIIDRTDIGNGIKLGEPPAKKVVSVKFDRSSYYSISNNGPLDILGIELTVNVSRRVDRIPLTRVFQYSDSMKPIVQVSEGTIPFDNSRTMIVQLSKNPLPLVSDTETADSIGNESFNAA